MATRSCLALSAVVHVSPETSYTPVLLVSYDRALRNIGRDLESLCQAVNYTSHHTRLPIARHDVLKYDNFTAGDQALRRLTQVVIIASGRKFAFDREIGFNDVSVYGRAIGIALTNAPMLIYCSAKARTRGLGYIDQGQLPLAMIVTCNRCRCARYCQVSCTRPSIVVRFSSLSHEGNESRRGLAEWRIQWHESR